MKLIQRTAIGICLFTSMSVSAQQTGNDTTTKFTPPVIVKNEDSLLHLDTKEKEYKSKEWQQGNKRVSDVSDSQAEKPKTGLQKKMKTPPPPPPPHALPPAPPPPPANE